MGDFNHLDSTNLPDLRSGCRFPRGTKLALDHKHSDPLCRLYVSMLQKPGIPDDRSFDGSGIFMGLEPVS